MLAGFYPTVMDAVALHEFIMQRHGVSPAPLRDEGALAHAFIDGNKRTAFAVADTFLDAHGWSFSGDYLQLAQRLVAIVATTDQRERDQLTTALIAWLDPLLVPTGRHEE